MRKLDKKRLHKLTKIIVVTISALSLLVGILNFSSLEKNKLYYLDQFQQCSDVLLEGVSAIDVCGFYFDAMAEQENTATYATLVGIGLPIIFFGGTRLYNYLFPEKDLKE